MAKKSKGAHRAVSVAKEMKATGIKKAHNPIANLKHYAHPKKGK
jgi:hypothetical protein